MRELGWTNILLNARPEQIEALLDRGLSAVNSFQLVMRFVASGKNPWFDIWERRISKECPMTISDIDELMRMRYGQGQYLRNEDISAILTAQARNHTDHLSTLVAANIEEQIDHFRAAALFLAGLDPRRVAEHAAPVKRTARAFVSRLSSSHQHLEFHRTCGDLTTFLSGESAWCDWYRSLTSSVGRDVAEPVG